MGKARPSKVAVCYCVYQDASYLAESLRSCQPAGDPFVFVSRIPWHGHPGDWEAAVAVARQAGGEVIVGEWTQEHAQRNAALEWLAQAGYTHAVMPRSDAMLDPALLEALLRIARSHLADRVYGYQETYWYSPEYVIRPRAGRTAVLMVSLTKARIIPGGDATGGHGLLLADDYGVVHDLACVGPDARIREKMADWSAQSAITPGWYEAVWQAWQSDHLIRGLHPTRPSADEFAERIVIPPVLRPALDRFRLLAGTGEDLPLTPGSAWPTLSVVIPVDREAKHLAGCLERLAQCSDLIAEAVVIGHDASEIPEVAACFPGVRAMAGGSIRGLPAAWNQGIAQTTGEVVLFLKSEALVPRAGLIQLIEALMGSRLIAACGPCSNEANPAQQVEATYTSLETLELFAKDFALRPVEDIETDMLGGFCLAVKRQAMDEVGGFDERFGPGPFAENDLCYRLRRAGCRLAVATRSFIHRAGAQPLEGMGGDIQSLSANNQALFLQKWHEDLETGFASHLSGLGTGRIAFDPSRNPDLRRRRVQELARLADISLCMIVKNEERVLRPGLLSARPFFREMIVVDTGSTDQTRAIAEAAGAQVYEFPWTDSFAEARNESLRHAKGRWIFWMDADDTLPWVTGEALLEAVLKAPAEIVGFVVPVQFVDDGSPPGGTRVDHLKLFRNRPGLRFEGHIHEQILPSIRATGGGQIARVEAVVLHSGYDTSPEGQANKRARDMKLLHRDIEEAPDHPFRRFNLGMTHHYMGEHEAAVEWLTRCLEVSSPEESHVRKAYALLAVSQRELGRIEACLKTLEQGLAITPDDPELHFHAALVLTGEGHYGKAKEHYLKILSADLSDHFSSVDMGILGYKTYHNLGSLCMTMGLYPEARHWWLKAIEAAPGFLPSTFELFQAALRRHDFTVAQQMLHRVESLEGPSENWAKMGVHFQEGVLGNGQGEAWLQQAVQTHEEAVGPRLVLTRKLLEGQREEEAAKHLHLLNEQGIAEAAFCLGVMANRRGDFAEALHWMERALILNPEHEATREQVRNLKRALETTTP